MTKYTKLVKDYTKFLSEHHSDEYLRLIEGRKKEFTEYITSDLEYIKITEDYIAKLKILKIGKSTGFIHMIQKISFSI